MSLSRSLSLPYSAGAVLVVYVLSRRRQSTIHVEGHSLVVPGIQFACGTLTMITRNLRRNAAFDYIVRTRGSRLSTCYNKSGE